MFVKSLWQQNTSIGTKVNTDKITCHQDDNVWIFIRISTNNNTLVAY